MCIGSIGCEIGAGAALGTCDHFGNAGNELLGDVEWKWMDIVVVEAKRWLMFPTCSRVVAGHSYDAQWGRKRLAVC